MIPRLSRSQPTSAPATATEPSSAYVGGRVAETRRDGRDEAVAGVDRPLPGVHEQEAARAIGALALPRLETGLAEQRGMLVAEVARDRAPRRGRRRPPRRPRTMSGSRAASPPGTPTASSSDGLPRQRLEAHEHRPRRVRRVGDVDAAPDAAGEVPDEPRVDRPEQQIAGLGGGQPVAAARLEDPGELERGGVGRDRQPGQRPEAIGAGGIRRPPAGRRRRRFGCPARRSRCGPAARSGGPRRRSSRAGR